MAAPRVVRRTIAQPADGSDFYVTISPGLATGDYGIAPNQVKGAVLVVFQLPLADRTNATFRVITSAALATGDIVEFTCTEAT